MTRPEFNTAFKALHSRYPGFAMPDPKTVGDIWFADLRRYSLKTFNRAIPQIEEAAPQFFPTCGVVRNICQGIEEVDHIQMPTKWIQPHDHGCGLSGSIEISGIRALLYHASPYEALHVRCTGLMTPRCPVCGADVPPWINPFISGMMDLYPDETECWNNWHKGTLLCIDCERKGKR